MAKRAANRSKWQAGAALRVVGYVRVSTDKQAETGLSLDAQEARIRAWCAACGHDLSGVVVDAGASAATLDRPGLTRVRALLSEGHADAVIVAKLDRLVRSMGGLAELLADAAREGWALLSVAETLDTSTAAGRMVVGMFGVVAQWEREAIGERTAAAMQAKVGRGETTGSAPLGYRATRPGGALAVDPGESRSIARARELRTEGLSYRAIAVRMNEEGCVARGARWHHTTVARVLATDAPAGARDVA